MLVLPFTLCVAVVASSASKDISEILRTSYPELDAQILQDLSTEISLVMSEAEIEEDVNLSAWLPEFYEYSIGRAPQVPADVDLYAEALATCLETDLSHIVLTQEEEMELLEQREQIINATHESFAALAIEIPELSDSIDTVAFMASAGNQMARRIDSIASNPLIPYLKRPLTPAEMQEVLEQIGNRHDMLLKALGSLPSNILPNILASKKGEEMLVKGLYTSFGFALPESDKLMMAWEASAKQLAAVADERRETGVNTFALLDSVASGLRGGDEVSAPQEPVDSNDTDTDLAETSQSAVYSKPETDAPTQYLEHESTTDHESRLVSRNEAQTLPLSRFRFSAYSIGLTIGGILVILISITAFIYLLRNKTV